MKRDYQVALHLVEVFVGRTMNWLYDHLCCVPRYKQVIVTEKLKNRTEFPEMEAIALDQSRILRRVWSRLAGRNNVYPWDLRRINGFRPVVLHSHFGNNAIAHLPVAERLDCPWFVSFYGADVYEGEQDPKAKAHFAPVFARARLVLALGPVMAEHLEQLGCPAEKIRIHPLGVGIGRLPSKERKLTPGEPLRILFAGTFREKKGVEYLVQAVGIARDAGVPLKLELVGDAQGKKGDQQTKQAILSLLRELGLESITTQHSYLQFSQLIQLALESHLFIGPSVTAGSGDREGTPFVLQQMMATGMPAIATQHSDIPYIFGPLSNLLVPERDAKAIAERIQFYYGDPQALTEDGLRLRERIASFALKTTSAHLAELYDSVCQAQLADAPLRLQAFPGT